jgi:hypothetical protein
VASVQRDGLRRTNEDKRGAVEQALKHPKAGKMSDRAIAEHCGVTHSFVAKVREEVATTGNRFQSPAPSAVTSGAAQEPSPGTTSIRFSTCPTPGTRAAISWATCLK